MSSRITCRVGILTPSTSNPYAQGWDASSSQGTPSVFGALPYPGPTLSSSGDYLPLVFSPLNPTILNCMVVGPQNQPFFRICTDAKMPGYTVWKDVSGKGIALVEWQAQPTVEIRGFVGKQRAKDWLRLSRDRSYRTMEVHGVQYVWTPHGSSICLYNKAMPSQMLARVIKSHTTVTLELTQQAMQLRLLEACVVATALLQSGRNID